MSKLYDTGSYESELVQLSVINKSGKVIHEQRSPSLNEPQQRETKRMSSAFMHSIVTTFGKTLRNTPTEQQGDAKIEQILTKIGVKYAIQKPVLRVLSDSEKSYIISISGSLMEGNMAFTQNDEDLVKYFKSHRNTDSILLLILKTRISNATSSWIQAFCALRGKKGAIYGGFQ